MECHSTTEREVEGRQVLAEVTHSGLCGTDEHGKCQDMVLGHEGVGVVRAIGDSVTGLKM
jgi:D-arabinose 1-dehydrogenase-like Zn-dependent alcohol dehydrogenase